MLGSNQRPPPCRGGALPAELIARGGPRLPTATLALAVVRGDVAEWLRSGLQSRLHRFDSGRRLRRIPCYYVEIAVPASARPARLCPERVPRCARNHRARAVAGAVLSRGVPSSVSALGAGGSRPTSRVWRLLGVGLFDFVEPVEDRVAAVAPVPAEGDGRYTALAGLGVDPAGGDAEHGGDVLGGEKVLGGAGGGVTLHSVLVSVALPGAGVSRPFLVDDPTRELIDGLGLSQELSWTRTDRSCDRERSMEGGLVVARDRAGRERVLRASVDG